VCRKMLDHFQVFSDFGSGHISGLLRWRNASSSGKPVSSFEIVNSLGLIDAGVYHQCRIVPESSHSPDSKIICSELLQENSLRFSLFKHRP
jgi:hypothetical protein